MTAPPLDVLDLTSADAGVIGADVIVEAGTTTLLGAPAGTSGSAMLDLVSGLARPETGTVLLAGQDVTHLPAAVRARRGLVRTFRRPGLAAGHTALENVVALRSAAESSVWQPLLRPGRGAAQARRLHREGLDALAAVGLADAASAPVATLPLAAARRVELAGALLRRPRVLLVDDPLADLDDADSAAVVQALGSVLGDLGSTCAVLVVATEHAGLLDVADVHELDVPFLLASQVPA